MNREIKVKQTGTGEAPLNFLPLQNAMERVWEEASEQNILSPWSRQIFVRVPKGQKEVEDVCVGQEDNSSAALLINVCPKPDEPVPAIIDVTSAQPHLDSEQMRRLKEKTKPEIYSHLERLNAPYMILTLRSVGSPNNLYTLSNYQPAEIDFSILGPVSSWFSRSCAVFIANQQAYVHFFDADPEKNQPSEERPLTQQEANALADLIGAAIMFDMPKEVEEGKRREEKERQQQLDQAGAEEAAREAARQALRAKKMQIRTIASGLPPLYRGLVDIPNPLPDQHEALDKLLSELVAAQQLHEEEKATQEEKARRERIAAVTADRRAKHRRDLEDKKGKKVRKGKIRKLREQHPDLASLLDGASEDEIDLLLQMAAEDAARVEVHDETRRRDQTANYLLV
jgi:hypothetical protein